MLAMKLTEASTRRFEQRQATRLLPEKENRNNLSTQSSSCALIDILDHDFTIIKLAPSSSLDLCGVSNMSLNLEKQLLFVSLAGVLETDHVAYPTFSMAHITMHL